MKAINLTLAIFSISLLIACGKNPQSGNEETATTIVEKAKEGLENFEKIEKGVSCSLEKTLQRVAELKKTTPFSVEQIKKVFPKEINGFNQKVEISDSEKDFTYKDANEQEVYMRLIDFARESNALMYMYCDFLKSNRKAIKENKDGFFEKTKKGEEVLFIPSGNTTDFVMFLNDRFEVQMRADDIEKEKALAFAEELLESVRALK